MAHIVLTGATGTAGAAVLSFCLASTSISHVSVLSRRPVAMAQGQAKATVIIHKDFETYSDNVLAQLKGATGCIWAQGISSRGMNEEDYTKITVDYPLAAAKAFSRLGPEFNFVYISGEGAKTEGNPSMMFARVKGRAERELLALPQTFPSLRMYNIRPGGIHTGGKHEAERPPNWTDRISTMMGLFFELVWRNGVIRTDVLAKACVAFAVGDGHPASAGTGVEAGGRLLRNTALRKLGGA